MLYGGDRGYCAWGSLGMRVLDFSNIRQPRLVSTVDLSPPFDGGIPVHNAYPMPQRKLVFMNGERTVGTAGRTLCPGWWTCGPRNIR